MIKRWATPHDFYLGVNGQYIDFDKAYGVQCVDLFDYFASQMQVQFQWVNGAKDFWEKFSMSANFEKVSVANLKDGDWVVFNGNLGYGYGHIAMFRKWDDANKTKATILGQNQIVGNAVACQISHSMANCYGGLRLKGWLVETPSKPSTPAKVDNILRPNDKCIFPVNYKVEKVVKINGVWCVYNSKLGAYINVALVTETDSKGNATKDQYLGGDISQSYFKVPGTFTVESSGTGTFKNGYVILKGWGFKINPETLQEVA